MDEPEDPVGRADDLVLALRRLRRLVSQRDRLPHDSRDRSAIDREIDAAQRETWRLASTWDETEPRAGRGLDVDNDSVGGHFRGR